MKELKTYILGFLMILTLLSCEKSPKCWGKSVTNEGLIIADTTLCSNCSFLSNTYEGFVVNNQNDLNKIFAGNQGSEGNCELHSFDFTKYSLLGMSTITNCKYKITKSVNVDEASQTYYYDIHSYECGDCIEKQYHSNWVLIPKLKKDYKVVFRSSVD